jgi:hypothetical protein
MPTLDIVKEYRKYYEAPTHPEIVDLEPAQYLTISGRGAPGGELHLKSIEALYAVAAAVAAITKLDGHDFELPKLEGQWWFDEDKPLSEVPRDQWRWKLLIRVPDYVTSSVLSKAQSAVLNAKDVPRIHEVKIETIDEGQSIQMLHVGPYENEAQTVVQIFSVMKARGLSAHGLHHEIYLSDVRNTDPSSARTIVRYPVK